MNPSTSTERYAVISADAHAGGEVYDYKPYLERRWHDEFETWAASANNRWNARNEGRESSRNWDNERRVAENDADGVAAELIFPNTLPPFYPRHCLTAAVPTSRQDYERRMAGLRASNRWMVDFCAQAPGRRLGLVQILFNDIDDALDEIRWGKDAGLAAILIPGVSPDHELEGMWSDRYDPIWALACELDMPINQHVGAGGPEVGTAEAAMAAHMMESPFYLQRSMWDLLVGGAFDRYPQLRFVLTEIGFGWIGQVMRRLDRQLAVVSDPRVVHSRLFGGAMQKLKLLPSDYVRRNCYIAMSGTGSLDEVANRHDIGVDHVMWGSDYPHDEGTYPHTHEALRALFANVPPQECRKILGETAARLYGFDLQALTPVANRIGPLCSETHVPLDAYPEDSTLELYLGPLVTTH